MLESLTIHNYAIIDEMTVEFPGGLTVITGETGAGKSIVVDALELVLGARASVEMIRADAEELEITGVFTLDETVRSKGIPVETQNLTSIQESDEGLLILRREVRADGASRCFLNDRPVTLKMLRNIGDCLVDLHGQHDHQSLLLATGNVNFLDGFAGLVALADEVERLYNEFISVRVSIEKLKLQIEHARSEKELYHFQINEIDGAKISPGEDMELEREIQKLSRAAELKEFGWRAFQDLSESDGSVEEVLGRLTGNIEELSRSDPALVAFIERTEELTSGLSELAGELRRYADEIDDDPAALAVLEERFALIERIKKKYGPRLDDVFAYREKIGSETRGHEDLVQKLETLEFKLEDIKPELFYRALKLSENRKETAPKLAAEVESHLAELGMNGAKLIIDISGCEGGEELEIDGRKVTLRKGKGIDEVEFMFTANPGEPPRPLAKIASGGEVSRVMLSLKLALSSVDRIPTMVFDEIDVGVSGRVAEAVGRKLLKLPNNRQVIVVTHLPQIAGKALRHFSARKTVEHGRTRTGLILLDDDMRQKELASMLSGETLTDTALAHAKELMKYKKKEE